jgi:hypothetical protein
MKVVNEGLPRAESRKMPRSEERAMKLESDSQERAKAVLITSSRCTRDGPIR